MEILVIIATEPNKTNAVRMAKLLIKEKIAACVSIKQIFSIYEWDDDIEETREFEITIKSKPEFKDNLIDFLNKTNNFFYIDNLKDINNVDLENKNILLAIGSRFLSDTANYYMNCKANVFTRVLPTYESITKAFGSCIKNSNIAILEPSKNNERILEKKLCDFWEIDYVLCRESGSYSQKNWERIISGSNMKLFLVKRPKIKNDYSHSFNQYQDLINHIIKSNY